MAKGKTTYKQALASQKKLEQRLEYLQKRKAYILGLRENLSKNWEATKQIMVSSPRTDKQAILEAKYKSLNASLKDLDTRILRVGGGKDVLGLLGEKDAMKVNEEGETVPDYQQIARDRLIPYLVSAIQELSAEVKALKAKLEE